MNNIKILLLVIATCIALPSHAEQYGPNGIQEIDDASLSQMRGKFVLGGHAVAWFGVTMISSWQTASGQMLSGKLTIGMDFSNGKTPTLKFVPTVSITNPTTPDESSPYGRNIDGSGLANAQGLQQSIQIAGNGNTGSNSLRLNILDGDAPSTITTTGNANGSAQETLSNSSAVAAINGNAASLRLRIDGQGEVAQWLHSGSVGQRIQLLADGQQAQNQMQIDLIRQSALNSQSLTQNVAASIFMTRGIVGPSGH